MKNMLSKQVYFKWCELVITDYIHYLKINVESQIEIINYRWTVQLKC